MATKIRSCPPLPPATVRPAATGASTAGRAETTAMTDWLDFRGGVEEYILPKMDVFPDAGDSFDSAIL